MNNYGYYVIGKKELPCRPALAKKYFEEAYKFSGTRYKALLQLISISLKDGNYKTARNLINKHMAEYENRFRFNICRQHLESIEYNFDRQRTLIYKSMGDENYSSSLFNLAEIDLQLGDYPLALDRFYELLDYDKYFASALFNMIVIKILEGDLDSAYDLLGFVDFNKLNELDVAAYRDLRNYIKFMMGKLREAKLTKLSNYYKCSRLFNDDVESLLNHLEKHKHCRKDHNDTCFLKELDLRDLVEEVEEYLEVIRPTHHFGVDKYKFKMNKTIGRYKNKMLEDICVVTFLNTKKIITMYPVSLSYEFDQENRSHILVPSSKKTIEKN